jgi:hypothetical protein
MEKWEMWRINMEVGRRHEVIWEVGGSGINSPISSRFFLFFITTPFFSKCQKDRLHHRMAAALRVENQRRLGVMSVWTSF